MCLIHPLFSIPVATGPPLARGIPWCESPKSRLSGMMQCCAEPPARPGALCWPPSISVPTATTCASPAAALAWITRPESGSPLKGTTLDFISLSGESRLSLLFPLLIALEEMSYWHLKHNICKTKLLIFPPKKCSVAIFHISVNGHFTLPVIPADSPDSALPPVLTHTLCQQIFSALSSKQILNRAAFHHLHFYPLDQATVILRLGSRTSLHPNLFASALPSPSSTPARPLALTCSVPAPPGSQNGPLLKLSNGFLSHSEQKSKSSQWLTSPVCSSSIISDTISYYSPPCSHLTSPHWPPFYFPRSQHISASGPLHFLVLLSRMLIP